MATAAQIRLELTRAIELVTSRIGLAVLNNLRQATARDTAYHASRWVGAVGREPASRTTPSSRAGRAAQLSFAQQASSIAQISSYRFGQGDIIVGNDGDFIVELDQRDNFAEGAVRRAVTISLAGTGLTR